MIHVVLSDFTSDQLERVRRARAEAENAVSLSRHEAAKARAAAIEARHREYREAWATGRYVRALVLWFKILFSPELAPPPVEAWSPVSDAEQILRAGDAGQRLVIDRLAAQLDDQWIALSGYTNRRGEIDTVLVGPAGIACIEVKALNAQLTIDGDEWVRRRIGRSGDILDGPSPVLDRGGRSPSRQLSEPTQHLTQWLQRHGCSFPLHRWVVLAHANSTLGNVHNLTVDAVVHVNHLNAAQLFARKEIVELVPNDLERLRDLIERDHRHHAALRSRASGTRPEDSSKTHHAAPRDGQGKPPWEQRARGGYADLPVSPWRPPNPDSLHERRLSVLADLSRRIAAGTAGEDQRRKLLNAVVQDLVNRDEPSETPDLLMSLRRGPAAAVVQQMVDEAMQVYELADRSLVGLVVPVSVRYRSFGEEALPRCLAGGASLRALGPIMAKALSARQVIFDRRLYEQSSLSKLSAKQWRDYLLGLDTLQANAQAATAPMTIGPRLDGQWVVVCIVGVAVCEPAASAGMRRLGRIPLSPVVEAMFETSMLALDPRHMVSATVEESASWGVWTVPPGLRAAAALGDRIAIGLQGASSSRFSTPQALEALRRAVPR